MTVTVTVSSGQTYNVPSGETDINDIVLAGGTLNVLSGGIAIDTVDRDGTITVAAGGRSGLGSGKCVGDVSVFFLLLHRDAQQID